MNAMDATALKPCPDCQVRPGIEHETGCDWARCLHTGEQRLGHDIARGECAPPDHDCGRDVWTGETPGVEDARRLGWFSYFRPDHGQGIGFQRCPPDDPRGTPDLNRLAVEARWDRTTHRWEPR